jgi:hypothetical protein
MKMLWRPSLVLTAAAVLAAVLIIRSQFKAADTQPGPLPLAAGDREIVWLSPATSAAGWERFVAAVQRVAGRLQSEQPDLSSNFGQAFPEKTTDVPEVSLAWAGTSRRLVFRWYKLTSNWKTSDWVPALVKDRRPPLAIIGGSSSDAARELAGQLQFASAGLAPADRPVLVLTTATADSVVTREAGVGGAPEERAALNQLYPERTFRFCFTNRQMATAVTRFLWSQDDLRPDSDPVHLVKWDDDSYSADLIDGFLLDALPALMAQEAVRDWAWVTGGIQAGAFPPLLGGAFPKDRSGQHDNEFRLSILPTVEPIASSVGSFQTANRYESQVANQVSEDLALFPRQSRPLLVVTGQAAPSRRFLRALAQLVPSRARHLVVVTGDTISFNTVYRDRRVAWPIQDLPFSLVFFCHYNPVDANAGFHPARDAGLSPRPGGEDIMPPPSRQPGNVQATSTTGTEDVLLNADIVEALARAFQRDGQPCADAAELNRRLADVRVGPTGLGFDPDWPHLFGPEGNRRSATGEHVVCLRPSFEGARVLPQATLEVWKWQPPSGSSDAGPRWLSCGGPFTLSFDPPAVEGGINR